MNILHSLNLARIDANIPQLFALLIPIAGVIAGAVIVMALIDSHNKRRQMWHETARLALEKGQPLPLLFENQDQAPRSRARSDAADDIRTGLISLAVGAPLYLFLGPWVGAIPCFVGAALLLFGLVRLIAQRRAKEQDSRPRQS